MSRKKKCPECGDDAGMWSKPLPSTGRCYMHSPVTFKVPVRVIEDPEPAEPLTRTVLVVQR